MNVPPLRRAATVPAAAVAVFLTVATLCVVPPAPARDKPEQHTVEWFVREQPQRMRALFDNLNLHYPGLDEVRTAYSIGDYAGACEALLAYYRVPRGAQWLRRPKVHDAGTTDAAAEAVMQDRFTFYAAEGTLKRSSNGAIDWTDRGPRRDQAWAASLNTLSYFGTLTGGYLRTGRTAYVERLDADLRDWIVSNPMPSRMKSDGPWRGTEVAARARTWMSAFYALQLCDAFSPAARLMMLSSISEHAQYLMLFHRREAGNWAVTEITGLATIATAWPELNDAAGWRRYTQEQIGRQMEEQVYRDGAQTELATTYHRVAAENFDTYIATFSEFGYAVPDSLRQNVQKMWSYLALTIRPDGTTPENNDSDRRDVRETLLAAARTYDRPDWVYIATGGRSGVAPAAGPSFTFPWAGQSVMRSNWGPDAQWSFFDFGPYGTAHQHADKLHLSIDAYGRPLLVDAGRYNYQPGKMRDYFTGSASHNVILIDGKGQKPNRLRARDPVQTSEYGSQGEWDYARGIFASGFDGVSGNAVHTRTVIYVRDRFWVVADRIETDRPRIIETLWHFGPECTARLEGRTVVTIDEDAGNLRIAPVGGVSWRPEIVAGVEKPAPQGWYSGLFNERIPNATAIYRAEIPGTTTFAWVLLPARGKVPDVTTTIVESSPERIELRVRIAGRKKDSWLITIPMNEWRPSVRREG
jgi:hypothetical protein